ncbi:hypothetical protein NL30_37855 [Burkholderia contaminans]|nr:hypothetical protein NL30_37855 [Burkholderia contaminans]
MLKFSQSSILLVSKRDSNDQCGYCQQNQQHNRHTDEQTVISCFLVLPCSHIAIKIGHINRICDHMMWVAHKLNGIVILRVQYGVHKAA